MKMAIAVFVVDVVRTRRRPLGVEEWMDGGVGFQRDDLKLRIRT